MIPQRVVPHGETKPLLESLFGKEKKPAPPAAAWTPVPEPIPGPQLIFDAGMAVPLPAELREGLEGVVRKDRLGKWVEGLSRLAGAVLLLLTAQLLLDYFLELPWLARAAFLAGDVWFLRLLWNEKVAKLLGSALTNEEAALRVEKQYPFLEGSLIGAVELAQGKPGATQGSPGLLRALVDEAAQKTSGLKMGDAVSLAKACRWGGAAAAILGLAILIGLETRASNAVLLQRMFLLNPAPPTITKVGQVTGDLVVKEGEPATLSARALGFVPSSGHVRLVYPDGREEDVPVRAPVSASEQDRFDVTIPGIREPFRYRFFLHDGEGSEYQVKVESAPVVQSLKLEPAEAGAGSGAEAPVSGKVYWEEGSPLRLAITASAPLKSAVLSLEIKGKKILKPMEIEGFGRKIARVEIPEADRDAERFFIGLLGENNVKSADQMAYLLERIPNPKALADAESGKPANPSAQNAQGMRAKDREDLLRLQSERVPDEYRAMVRQYLKNISGDAQP